MINCIHNLITCNGNLSMIIHESQEEKRWQESGTKKD